jgi:carboxypeptidase PM20D1
LKPSEAGIVDTPCRPEICFFIIVIKQKEKPMRRVKRGLLTLGAALALFVGVIVVRTVMIHPAADGTASVKLAPVRAVDVDRAAAHLVQAIRIQTISRIEGVVDNPEAFLALQAFLKSAYPRLHAAMRFETVAGYSLLYTLPGSEPSLAPILLLAHQDVVPVEAGTEGDWEAPPFSGDIRDGYIYGRGAVDDKGSLVAVMEAMETLFARGFQPRRTVLLAFGHDEEVLGSGAKAIARLLGERNIRPWFVIDEGMDVLLDNPFTGRPAVLIGIAEKGYLTARVTARSGGGHSSMPPGETAAERLSKAILAIRSRPFPGHLDEGPVAGMLDALAPRLGFVQRAVIGNRWVFGPFLRSRMGSTPAGNALLRTTIAPTVIDGGTKENVLPQEVHALVNLRLNPRDSIASALEHLRRSVAGIDGIGIEAHGTPSEPSPVSSTTSDSYALLAAVARAHAPEDAAVAPMLVLGGTDSRFYASVAENIYRFAPAWILQSEFARIHGTGERLSLENLERMIQFYAQLVDTGTR